MSDNGKSILDLSNLTQPASILIEKISNAIGVLYEPKKIIKLAQAQAHADLIKFNSKAQLSELEQRAIHNLIQRETIKQDNIEKITANAILSLPPDANPEDISKDWLSYFFNHCDSVSEPEMQRVWGEILARKSSDPSSYSKKTISTLGILESDDAEIFTRFCSFALTQEGSPELYILDTDDSYFRDQNINYGSALHLEFLGLIHYSSEGFALSLAPENNENTPEDCHTVSMKYFERELEIIVPRTNMDNLSEDRIQISTGQVNFTTVGQELFTLCRAVPSATFIDYLRKKLKAQKTQIVEII
ncbi:MULTISPECIES: DUF2806 domain-containing protein [Pseudomonas]|uniref:DUF2806 domain-containing protein n=1 Tax=Pseudomonas TaxID=286 RepID=UPI001596A781|nr:DUF2806 domain-containing protein [Pseudomonas faucium]